MSVKVDSAPIICMQVVDAYFAELSVIFFMKTYKWCLVSFSDFVIVLIDW